MPDVRLDTGDAAELAELRQFLAEWLVRDPGPKSIEGGGFAAAHSQVRRACYGAAPPASKVLRIALRATAPCGAALDPGDHCGPWEQEKRAGPGLPPRCARRANPRRWRAHRSKPNVGTQVNWRSIVTRKRKITNLGWCCGVKDQVKPIRQGSSEARHRGRPRGRPRPSSALMAISDHDLALSDR